MIIYLYIIINYNKLEYHQHDYFKLTRYFCRIRHLWLLTLENRYGCWPQTGCVTVPGREAPFLVARERFPYRSRFNFSVKNMENMLPCNAICDIMHIDFSREIYCGANDASAGFKSKFIKSNESSQNVNVRDVLRHFAPINHSYWQCIMCNAHELFSKGEEWYEESVQLRLYMMIIVWNISTFLYNIEIIFTNGSLKLQWQNGKGSWGVCDAG